jgi:DNA-directed RNA polymerase specialized sigma24 family protein
MSFLYAQSERLTTREVAVLTGRSQGAVRTAILEGRLAGERQLDGWRVTREEALAWHARTRRIPCPSSSRPWNRAADMLAEYGAMTSEELARLLELNSGNARKHLAILAKEGRAERLPDGQWVLIDKQAGAA